MKDQIKSDNLYYDAFLSYSRKDRKFAANLEKSLENFKLPKQLNRPRRRLNIFRDEGDMTGTEYYKSIENHLQNSAKLIVICSQNARGSEYVNDEIKRFAKIRGPEHIIPIILKGVADNEAKPEQESEKAFPPALCEVMEMPLAISYLGFESAKERLDKGVFAQSWYSLLSNIYDISRSEIEQREKLKQRRNRRIISSIIASVILSLSFLAGIALWQRNVAIQNAKEAKRQKDKAVMQQKAALRSQSIFMAKQSREQLQIGRTDLAIKLALESLPENIDKPDRPLVATAEMALYAAFAKKRFSAIFDTEEDHLSQVVLSSDGKRLVTRNSGIVEQVRIWNTDTTELIATHHLMNYYATGLDVSADGRYLAIGFNQIQKRLSIQNPQDLLRPNFSNKLVAIPNEIQIFNLQSGQMLDRFGTQGPYNLYVRFHPHKEQLLYSDGKSMSLIEILVDTKQRDNPDDPFVFKTQHSNARMLFIHHNGAKAENAAFTKNGKTVALVNEDGIGILYDLTGFYGYRFIRDPKDKIVSITFSSDGEKALVLTRGGNLSVFETLSGAMLYRIPKEPENKYIAAKFCKANIFRTINHKGIVSDWQHGLHLKKLQSKEWENGQLIDNAFFDDGGQNAIIGFENGGVEMWSFVRNEAFSLLEHDKAKLVDGCFSKNDIGVVFASDDNIVRIWERKQSLGTTLFSTKDKPVIFSEFSPSGTTVAIGYKDGTLELRNVFTNNVNWSRKRAHDKAINYISFNPKGNLIITGSEDNIAKVWQASTGDAVHTLKGHTRAVSWAIFSHDGAQILTVGSDATGRLWDTESGDLKYVLPLPNKFKDPIHNASLLPRGAFTVDGRYVVTVTCGDCYAIGQPVLIWDRNTGKLLNILKHNGSIWGFQITPDDRYVVTSSYDQTSAIWDISTGKKIKTLTGHNSTVTNVHVYPDMKYIATSSKDATIRIWDFETGAQIHVLEGKDYGFLGMTISANGRIIAAGDGDGVLYLWDARSGFLIKKFPKQKGPITHVSFNKSGEKLLSIAYEKSVYIHSLPPQGQRLIDLSKKGVKKVNDSYLSKEQRIRFSMEER